MKATAPLLALAILAIAPSPALADPYRLHHDYYKLIAAKGAGAQSQTGFRVPVNPNLTWLHRGLTPPQAGGAGAQSQTGFRVPVNPNLTWLHRGLTPPQAGGAGAQAQTGFRVPVNPNLTWLHRGLTPPQAGGAGAQSKTGPSHGFPWSSIGVGLAAAAVAALLLTTLHPTRRTHRTAP